MIYRDEQELIDRIAEITGRRIRVAPEIVEDSSSYMNIVGGNVVRVGGNDYYVITEARENRFGVEEQPKFWVKYAFDIETGQRKIMKLVFHEEFTAQIGRIRIKCKRNPRKESAILDLVRDNPRFMQGFTVQDKANNWVRIIDVISGRSAFHYLDGLDMSHEEYFGQVFPDLMRKVIVCIEALADLHSQGHHHGDVRSDHLWIEHETGSLAWIDFDYEVSHTDYDIWGVGNLLIRLVGKGTHRLRDVDSNPHDYPLKTEDVALQDMALLLNDRIANLKKLFPYIPQELNDILMRFSNGSSDFYRNLNRLVTDLKRVL